MKIGIIVAMQKELDLLLPLMPDSSVLSLNGAKFHVGTIGHNEIIALKSGIGKVNAAIATLTLIENFHPGLVINTGVGGGTGHGASILDIVVGEKIAYHDCWCGPGTEWVRLPDSHAILSRRLRSVSLIFFAAIRKSRRA